VPQKCHDDRKFLMAKCRECLLPRTCSPDLLDAIPAARMLDEIHQGSP